MSDTKKYLNSDGLTTYTGLIKGKMDAMANELDGKINLKADASALSGKVDQSVYNTKIEDLQNQINTVNAMASNLSITASLSQSTIERDVATSVTVTAKVSGTFTNTDVTEIKANDNVSSGVATLSDTETITLSNNDQTNVPSQTFAVSAKVKGVTLTKSATVYGYYRIYYCATADFTNADGTMNETAITSIPNHAANKLSSSAKQNYTVTCPTYDTDSNKQNKSKFVLYVPVATTQPGTFKFDSAAGFVANLTKCESIKTINNIQYWVYYSAGAACYEDNKTLVYVNV